MSKKRRSAFVPRVIFGTMFVGVVPACALLNCGGDDTSGGSAGSSTAGTKGAGGSFGVGAVAFGGFAGVAAAGFSGSGGARAGGFGVASVAFTGFAGVGNGGTMTQDSGSDAPHDGGDAKAKDSGNDSSG